MRPPHFGQDITNQQNNRDNSSGRDNNEDGSNDRQSQIIDRLTQNGAMPVAKIAGKGIIRVVSRCEDAKENSALGEIQDVIYLEKKITKTKRSKRVESERK